MAQAVVTSEPEPKQRHRVPATSVRRPEEGGGFLAVIAAAAADPRCDVSKMQALLAMQKEIEAEQARLAYTQSKLDLTRKLPSINKDGRIEFKDKGEGKPVLKFASFENINDVIKPLLDEFDFDLWFSSEPGVSGMVNVIGHLDHARGHNRQTVFPMPHDSSGGKSGAQGWASAFSFGKRVTTIGLLNIQTRALEDRDRDGTDRATQRAKGGGFVEAAPPAPKVSPLQRDNLIERITRAGIKEAQFCTHYGVGQIGLLPAELYDAAVQAIADHVQKKKDAGAHG